MTPAARRRTQALGMLSELYLPTPAGEGQFDPESYPLFLWDFCGQRPATPGQVADNIDKLTGLGRTERWQRHIIGWARKTRSLGDDTGGLLRAVFLQGLIDATYAAR